MEAEKTLNKLLATEKMQSLLGEVKEVYKVAEIVFELSNDLDGHGAFRPGSHPPQIIINQKTGLNESNIAHELIHALQIYEGFPTTPKGLFADNRSKVAIELNANILHIPLVKEMKDRDFEIKPYLEPTLMTIEKVLSGRKKHKIPKVPYIRVHYEAAVFLRLKYEAKFLDKKEKRYFKRLFESKSPKAVFLGEKMVCIIEKENPYEPVGNLRSLYHCLLFLNKVDLRGAVPDFNTNLYEPLLNALEKKHPVLKQGKA